MADVKTKPEGVPKYRDALSQQKINRVTFAGYINNYEIT